MRVKVSPLNVLGKPLFKRERDKREVYAGKLKVLENREHRLGRAVTVARVVSTTDNTEAPLLELYDVALLWLEDTKVRLRGFEDVDGVQYAQTWDVEVV